VWEQLAGTYTRCIRFGSGRFASPEAYLVLYLLHSGRFLFFAYWWGFELTVAAGTWTAMGDCVELHGVGRNLQHDVLPCTGAPRPFTRTFTVTGDEASPVLTADGELEGWNLLGRSGALHYLGHGQMLQLDDDRLPRTWPDIELWIGKFLGESN
jgi:hypothetical protein